MKFIIEKDIYVNKWIVWEVRRNVKIDRYWGHTKKECQQWLKIGQ